MDLNLKGKTVVVTGGAKGIGKGIALEFAKEGCNIAVCDISEDSLAEVNEYFKNQNFKILAYKANVCDSGEISDFAQKVIETFGRLDIWTNNAGIVHVKPIIDLTLEEWERVIKTNINSVFLGIQAAAKEMIKTGGGNIVNIASYAGIMPTAYKASYAASKAGVIAITKETAGELAPYNIRVNSIAPGMIETDMMASRLGGPEREKIVNRIALQKTGTPEDIGKLCTFIASDAASFITGSNYEITGGMFCIQDILLPWGKY